MRPLSRAGVPTTHVAGGVGGGASFAASGTHGRGHEGKVGHALFHAMVHEHGSRPGQHLAEPVERLRAMGAQDAARTLLRSAPAGLYGTSELRQPPLSFYNAAR